MLNIAALVAGYMALLVLFSVMARPHRVRLARLANELIADYPDNRLVSDLCRHYVGTAYSMRAAPIRFLMYMAILFKPGNEIDRECQQLSRENPSFFSDERIAHLMEAYNASITAVSPVFGLLANIARFAFVAKAYIHHRGKHDGHRLTEMVELRVAT